MPSPLSLQDRPDQEALLEFLVSAEALRRKTSDLSRLSRGEPQVEQLQADRRALVVAIGREFFADGCPREGGSKHGYQKRVGRELGITVQRVAITIFTAWFCQGEI